VKFENLKILIVDDQASNQVLLTYLLEDDGHQVEGASNGEEAIAKRPSPRGHRKVSTCVA